MKLCSLFSGGKDSTMAMYKAMEGHEISVLLTMLPERDDSYMFHYPNIGLTKVQAEAMEIPIVQRNTSGKPPQENIDMVNSLAEIKEEFNIEGIVAGAVRSNYQHNIVSNACKELKLELMAPYWQHSHGELIKDAIDARFEMVIVGVAAHGLDDSWLGRTLDSGALEELKKLSRKFGIDIGGEGGEYETFVIDGPIFKKKIKIKDSGKTWDGLRGQLIIKKTNLG
ncbi:MAG: diphthine--ammonia ligase [Candidatus Altiarchaeales archaeon]|nr:diphthine--ammonia ligase [Candidatus Altiarchaeota archaeon]MBU4437112.1 diphthine--ammonia ligase [Candidatus Altiarchaeota archaeon]MCG2783008.1 diphthine--ammonia ligase [Candidatus Altiarchaeales archaeon]